MENIDGTVPSTAGTENINKAIEVSLAKKIKIRGSLRGAVTKLRNHIGERLPDGTVSYDAFYLKDNIQTIQQKIESLKKLDEEIIDLMESCDDDEVEGRMESEIEGSDSVRTDLDRIVDRMEDALKQLSPPPPIQQQMPTQGQDVLPWLYASTSQFQASLPSPKKTAKLPKLEVKKLAGEYKNGRSFGIPSKAPSTKMKASQW